MRNFSFVYLYMYMYVCMYICIGWSWYEIYFLLRIEVRTYKIKSHGTRCYFGFPIAFEYLLPLKMKCYIFLK